MNVCKVSSSAKFVHVSFVNYTTQQRVDKQTCINLVLKQTCYVCNGFEYDQYGVSSFIFHSNNLYRQVKLEIVFKIH